ncbi:Helix-turn-helix domain protein [compost metagenome]
MPLTSFGKFCRKLRVDNGELLEDLAKKLEVTSSYLSAVEMGKRNIPFMRLDKISKIYDLNSSEKLVLHNVVWESQLTLKINVSDLSVEDKNKIIQILSKY